MSTSAIRKEALKKALTYLWITIFCAFFGAVYEHFSHGVYSLYMLYAFAFPMVGGVLVWLGIGYSGKIPFPGAVSRNLWHAGIATCTVGSIYQGILEIYGTTSPYTNVYWIIGILLLSVGVFSYIIGLGKNND